MGERYIGTKARAGFLKGHVGLLWCVGAFPPNVLQHFASFSQKQWNKEQLSQRGAFENVFNVKGLGWVLSLRKALLVQRSECTFFFFGDKTSCRRVREGWYSWQYWTGQSVVALCA